jgi:hypothetical protein
LHKQYTGEVAMNTTSQAPETEDGSHRLGETRWAGAVLALGAVLYMIAIILFATVYGHPEGTGSGGRVNLVDIAAHTRAQWNLAQGIWSALCS